MSSVLIPDASRGRVCNSSYSYLVAVNSLKWSDFISSSSYYMVCKKIRHQEEKERKVKTLINYDDGITGTWHKIYQDFEFLRKLTNYDSIVSSGDQTLLTDMISFTFESIQFWFWITHYSLEWRHYITINRHRIYVSWRKFEIKYETYDAERVSKILWIRYTRSSSQSRWEWFVDQFISTVVFYSLLLLCGSDYEKWYDMCHFVPVDCHFSPDDRRIVHTLHYRMKNTFSKSTSDFKSSYFSRFTTS